MRKLVVAAFRAQSAAAPKRLLRNTVNAACARHALVLSSIEQALWPLRMYSGMIIVRYSTNP